MIEVFEAFYDFMLNYTRTRYTITNSFDGEVKGPSTDSVFAYIHADDYQQEAYTAQGQRIEDRIKIFTFLDADIKVNDEVTYQNRVFKVVADNTKIVGGYKKFLAELVK
jgi:hypothetical protein